MRWFQWMGPNGELDIMCLVLEWMTWSAWRRGGCTYYWYTYWSIRSIVTFLASSTRSSSSVVSPPDTPALTTSIPVARDQLPYLRTFCRVLLVCSQKFCCSVQFCVVFCVSILWIFAVFGLYLTRPSRLMRWVIVIIILVYAECMV